MGYQSRVSRFKRVSSHEPTCVHKHVYSEALNTIAIDFKDQNIHASNNTHLYTQNVY